MPQPTASSTVERAFQLARSGACLSLGDIRKALRFEGYLGVDSHLGSPSLSKQLGALIKASMDQVTDATD